MPFPLPEAPVDAMIGLYGQFDDAELSAIVASSADTLAHDDPIRHLLGLREQPYLELFRAEAGEDSDSVVAYRSAVCLGATMLRRFARDKAIDLSTLHANPDRRYLLFPDLPLPEAYRLYGAWPIMTEDFTDPHYYRRFFQSEASAERVKDLQYDLATNHIGFMEDDNAGQRAANFGFFCRGLLDTFELYTHLRREQNVAPAGRLFSPDKHQMLDLPVPWTSAETVPDLTRRWRVGGLATMRPHPRETLAIEEQIGHTNVPDRALVVRVSRGIGGLVERSAAPNSLAVPVLFGDSEEQFDLRTRDVLIVRESDTSSGVFNTLAHPFIMEVDAHYPSAEVVALCRDGQIKFLYDPAINLDTEESSLATAIRRAMQKA